MEGSLTSCISGGIGDTVSTINGFVDDPGFNNYAVGHRMFFLSPYLSKTSVGSMSREGGGKATMSVNVIKHYDSAPALPTRDGTITWPPAGYFPYQLLPTSTRWHYWPLNDKMVFSSATVSITGPTGPILGIKITCKDVTQFGTYIVFEVPKPPVPTEDTTYTVTIDNILGTPVQSVSYDVTLINIV